MDYLFIIIIGSLLFSAFFSGMEIAFISSNKLRIELDKKQKLFPYKIVSIFIKNPSQYIATMLIGNNIALVIYGILMVKKLDEYITFINNDIAILTFQTIISTIVILVIAEFLPKTVFMINPNIALNIFSVPVLIFYIIFYPVSKLVMWISGFLLKSFFGYKENPEHDKKVFGKVDLDNLVQKSQFESNDDKEIKQNIQIFQNALDFSEVKLRECMVPRTEIVALEMNSSVEELKQKFIETGFSRILIFNDSIDNIIGYVNTKEMFKNLKSISSKLVSVSIVPVTMPAHKLLNLFIRQKKNVAIVVDEFGGTAGMVTIEDIIEEIFGEIEDEHDSIELEERKISDNEYILSGRLEIDYLNTKYQLDIPVSTDYETIAGFILCHHESMPKLNERIIVLRYEFKVLKVSNTRLELVNLIIK